MAESRLNLAPLLELDSVSKRFAGLDAVHEVSLRVEPGEIVGLIGPNGAGKTTLFNIVSGALRASAGQVLWQGRHITRLPMHRIAALGLIRTFQAVRVFPNLTVFDNVLIARHRRTPGNLLADLSGLARFSHAERAARARAAEVLEQLGLAQHAETRASDLSYGLGKLVGVAVAFAAEPSLLMLDEPAGGLSADESSALTTLLRQIHAAGVSLWVVEHNMRFLMGLSQRVVVLDAGCKIADGPPEQVRADERVRLVYLGAGFDEPVAASEASPESVC
jgi:branched-chain amino acid transport system ATP-binding protein